MAMSVNLKSLLFSAIILSLAACGGGDKKNTKVPDPIKAVEPPVFNYQATIDNAITEFVPGIILQVEKPGFKFLGSAGLADVETQTSMQTYHVMPAGSAGKKIIALLTVMLDEEGLLNLDDTLDSWLAVEILAQIENSEKITLRQLLNHTSGIYNYLEDGSNTAEDYVQALVANQETLKTDSFALSFGLNQPAYFLPGEGFKYSNTNYVLVGLILDEVLGEHHSSAIRNRILNPFGMNASFYRGVEKSFGEIVSGYMEDDEEGMVNTKLYLENVGISDAPLSSSVEDMTLLLKNIVGQGAHVSDYVKEQIFGESALMSWCASFYGSTDECAGYGLGLFKETIKNQVVYFHDGHEPGYRAMNIYIADSQTSITAFFNCGNYTRCDKAADALVEKVLANEL